MADEWRDGPPKFLPVEWQSRTWENLPDKDCPVCGTTFKKHSPRSKFCSESCQRRMERLRKAAKEARIKKSGGLL